MEWEGKGNERQRERKKEKGEEMKARIAVGEEGI